MKRIITSFFIFVFTTFLFSVDIGTIISSYEKNSVYETAYAECVMLTTDNLGTTENSFKNWARKNGDTLIEIKSGPDKGQKILRKGASIFLFYPDAEEVIRLQGSALKDSLMGSDFSYEDLTGENSLIDRYTSTLIGEEIIDNRLCYHIMMIAKKKKETYRKQETWIDKELNVSLKTILYSASGKAMRELRSESVKKINGHNIATKMIMKDLLKKNSRTILTIDNIIINEPVDRKLFTRENLTW